MTVTKVKLFTKHSNDCLWFQELLDSGVPADDRDDFGDLPQHYAAKSGCYDVIKMLLAKGCVPCTTGKEKHIFCLLHQRHILLAVLSIMSEKQHDAAHKCRRVFFSLTNLFGDTSTPLLVSLGTISVLQSYMLQTVIPKQCDICDKKTGHIFITPVHA